MFRLSRVRFGGSIQEPPEQRHTSLRWIERSSSLDTSKARASKICLLILSSATQLTLQRCRPAGEDNPCDTRLAHCSRYFFFSGHLKVTPSVSPFTQKPSLIATPSGGFCKLHRRSWLAFFEILRQAVFLLCASFRIKT